VLSGVQFLTTGVLAEMLTRVYHETAQRPQYQVRTITPADEVAAWKMPATREVS
jgi:hypothetical protein